MHRDVTIIRYPEGHPIRVAAEAEHAAQIARRNELAKDPRIAAAIRFITEQGEARRPCGSLWPASVTEAEALNCAGMEISDDAVAVLREWAFRARPVTINYGSQTP